MSELTLGHNSEVHICGDFEQFFLHLFLLKVRVDLIECDNSANCLIGFSRRFSPDLGIEGIHLEDTRSYVFCLDYISANKMCSY